MSNNRENALSKFKQFLKGGKSHNFPEQTAFRVTAEMEAELRAETPIHQRIRTLNGLARDIQSERLEENAVQRLWELTADLLNADRPAEHRQAGFNFYKTLIRSQFEALAEMRTQFFRVIQEHAVPEDIGLRLDLLWQLTNEGRDITLFERDVGPFLVAWAPAIVDAHLMVIYLLMVSNMIQFNAACLDRTVIAGIVNLSCVLQSRHFDDCELVTLCLSVLEKVIFYSMLPLETLSACVIVLCNTGARESYVETSWRIMKHLLGTALGHAALWTMCGLLNDESNYGTEEHLLCGAVFHTNMSLWGGLVSPAPPPQSSSLRCSTSTVLASMLKVLQCRHYRVSYEVAVSVQRLISNQGAVLSEVTWDLICDILEALAENVRTFERQQGNAAIQRVCRETVDACEALLQEGRIQANPARFYGLIERTVDQRSERSVALLMDYRMRGLVATRPQWIAALFRFLETHYRTERRTAIRVKAVDCLQAVVAMNRAAYEDELLERVILVQWSGATLAAEKDVRVKVAVARLLIDFARHCDSKRCVELLHILELQLNAAPFEQKFAPDVAVAAQSPGNSSSSSTSGSNTGGGPTEMDYMLLLVDGLIQVFLVKLYRQPSSNAVAVFHMLVAHLERHYESRLVTANSGHELRYKIFEWMLQARANSTFNIGYPEAVGTAKGQEPVVRFSNYLGIDAKQPIYLTSAVSPKEGGGGGQQETPPPASSYLSGDIFTTISIRRGCKVIVKCLETERNWTVYSLVLREIPNILQNKALIEGNDVDALARLLCMLNNNSRNMVDELVSVRGKPSVSEFQTYVLPAIASLVAYHQILDSSTVSRIIDCLMSVKGLSPRNARVCVQAMTVMTLEMPDTFFRFVPEILLGLSKVSQTVQVASPVLEFLSTLSRLPLSRFVSFVQVQYMYVFAIALPYTNPYRYNHYVVSLAHHVIAGWFLKSRLSLRNSFVKYIVTGLDRYIRTAHQERVKAGDYVGTPLVNEDSSSRKRSSSLKEQSSANRDQAQAQALTRKSNDDLFVFHMELAETCIDFLARHIFSPCAALPKRLATTDYILAGGQSRSWLVGHNVVTITTSGCSGVPKGNNSGDLCERCSTLCRMSFQGAAAGGGGGLNSSSTSTSSANMCFPQKSAQDSESTELTSTSTSSTNLNAPSSAHSQQLPPPQQQQQRFHLQRQSSSDGPFSSNSGSLEALSRRGSNPDTTESTSSEAGAGAGTTALTTPVIVKTMPQLDNPISITSASSPDSRRIRQLCVCSCLGWAEIHVRRPTGNMSWVMRVQNQIYQDCFGTNEMPLLHDISQLFSPSLGAFNGDQPPQPQQQMPTAPTTPQQQQQTMVSPQQSLQMQQKQTVLIAAAVVSPEKIQEAVMVAKPTEPTEEKSCIEPPKAISGPIDIPKPLAKPKKESGSISDRDDDEDDGDDGDVIGRGSSTVAFDDEDEEEQDGRSRNPVRRVNSSPEMSSNYRNPYLMSQNNKQKDVISPSAAVVVTSSGGGSGGGGGGNGLTDLADPADGSATDLSGTGTATEGLQKKKSYGKDMRVSCEAIPEEMTGQTPPSNVGSTSNESSVLGERLVTETQQQPERLNKSEMAAEATTKSPELMTAAVKSSVKKSEDLKLQVNLKIPSEQQQQHKQQGAKVVTAKPPQSPAAPLSPRLMAKAPGSRFSPGSVAAMDSLTAAANTSGGSSGINNSGSNANEEVWRGRSNTISVIRERYSKHSTLRDRVNSSAGVQSGGFQSRNLRSGDGHFSSGGNTGGTGGSGGSGGGSGQSTTTTRSQSGISPSFVFLQLFNAGHVGGNAQERPLLVDPSNESYIKLLDYIPPLEIHKIGVLYIGPGQTHNEAEILRNRCGSRRYTRFLNALGHLISIRAARENQNIFSDLVSDSADGAYTYIWQDDIVQVHFHVATLMANKETDPNANEKKKHIGNDLVTIVYNESGETFDLNTIKTQFLYVFVVVEPLELQTNRVYVRVRDASTTEFMTEWDMKIVGDDCAPLLARQLALHANLASLISKSLQKKQVNDGPYASNWLERLRKIKRLRQKLLMHAASTTSVSSTTTTTTSRPGMTSGGVSLDHVPNIGGGPPFTAGVQPHHHRANGPTDELARRFEIGDFTTYSE